MSSSGLIACFEVLSAPEPFSTDTISRPSVLLVAETPSK